MTGVQTCALPIYSEVVNPYIDFENSPFRLQRSLQPWLRPVVEIDGRRVELPRLAGLSSFGAGGANGHMIVEEYVDDARAAPIADVPKLFVLSARKEQALRTMAVRLAERLRAEPSISLEDAAYTLQIGRVPMEFRIAFLAESREALLDALQTYGERGVIGKGAWSGRRDAAKRDPSTAARLEAAADRIEDWIRRNDLAALAQAWVDGAQVEWRCLHAPSVRRRISLPGYAFQRQRYWGPETSTVESVSVLHPLIDANVSTLEEQSFSKTFRPEEFYLRDHRLGDNRVLPGVVYLELALQAVRLAAPRQRAVALRDIHWLRPVIVNEAPQRIRISLQPKRDAIAFSVYAEHDESRAPYATGAIELTDEAASDAMVGWVDLDAVMRRSSVLDRNQVDAVFVSMGFVFGESFRVFDALYHNAEESLGLLHLPTIAGVRADDFVLHPALMDAAIRASLGVGGLSSAPTSINVPVRLGRIRIDGPLTDRVYAYCRRSPDTGIAQPLQCFDVLLCDADGRVRISIEQLVSTPAPQLALMARRAQSATAKQAPATVEHRDVARAVAPQPSQRIREVVAQEATPGVDGEAPRRATDRKSTRLNSSHSTLSRMPSSA